MKQTRYRRKLEKAWNTFMEADATYREVQREVTYSLFKKYNGDLCKISDELGITRKTALDWYRSARIVKGEI